MGESRVTLATTHEQIQNFEKSILKDMRALDKMLKDGWFTDDTIRIGAEQELCLVDHQAKALPESLKVLDALGEGNYTTELAKFNLEINLDPLEFKDKCLSDMEKNLADEVEKVSKAVNEIGGDILLTGILPTIRKRDVEMDNLTPLPRYKALCDAINKLRGENFDLRIQGMDELLMRFNSPLLEAINTGFQVHLQVNPEDFVNKYNIAQAVTGPILATAVNSPMLFGKRLWAETRIAIFRQSVDTRVVSDHLRDSLPRVTFGSGWLKDSILEIYKEDISRYRVLLSTSLEEDVQDMMAKGIPPELYAIKIHNSTVYRWNRPCYGITNGKPHLRIENRALPSGPTVIDEIANAAVWLGLLNGIEDECKDITEELDFDHAKMNFFAASKMGMDTKFTWTKERRISARDLMTDILIPIARHGLEKVNIDSSDINTYMDVIQQRIDTNQTGSHWMVKSFNNLAKNNSREQALTAVTKAMIKNQKKGEPSYKWPMAHIDDIENWKPSMLLVEEFMTTDLFTVQKDDILEFVAYLLEWRKIRYAPVEDDQKHLVGIVTMRMVLREYAKELAGSDDASHTVEQIMIENPITIHPEASILESINIMQDNKIGCLPVVKNNRLVGVITEHNFMDITRNLLNRLNHSI